MGYVCWFPYIFFAVNAWILVGLGSYGFWFGLVFLAFDPCHLLGWGSAGDGSAVPFVPLRAVLCDAMRCCELRKNL